MTAAEWPRVERRKVPRGRRGLFAPTFAPTGWAESTYAEVLWDKSRGAVRRWGLSGALLGALIGGVAFAPAAWLARPIASMTDQRLLLADARGTVWSGSAQVVLSGGPGSRDAASLPGRLAWTLLPRGLGVEVQARHDCCLNGTVTLRVNPGFGRVGVTLLPSAGWVGRWPSALLAGLGTPWNTLQLGGTMRLLSPGLTLESAQGRWQLVGRAELELQDVSSPLTTLERLGSYRLSINGDPANAGVAQLTLATLDGPLQLSGTGTWGAAGVRLRGEAQANAADEAALSNLLNIIGRRQGARSVISIG